MAQREFDIVVYGASGFTGEFVAKELQILNKNGENVSFALAGRSQEKLDKVKQKFNLNVPIIIADTENSVSIEKMVKSTRVLINCVGPFREHGAPVVKACAAHGTDYVDICGEPEFLEQTELNVHDLAVENGSTIIGSCGTDSIPADLGMEYAIENLKKNGGECLSVESFLSLVSGPSGYRIHYTTYQCAIEGFGRVNELKKVRKALDDKRNGVTLQRPEGPKLKLEAGPTTNEQFPKKSIFAFPGADASVCKRSQMSHQMTEENYKAPYHACYFNIPEDYKMQMMLRGGAFQTLAQWGWGRSLLLAHPKFFSNGVFSHEGPSDEQVEQTSFKIEFVAKSTDGSKTVLTRFSGPDPGYIGTASLVCGAALTILDLKHRKKYEPLSHATEIAMKGGVYPPGFAFKGTKMMERLENRGFKIEEVSSFN